MQETNGDAIEAIENIWYEFEEFSSATHEFHKGRHLLALSQRLEDAASIHDANLESAPLPSAGALYATVDRFKVFNEAPTLTARAAAFDELANRVSDLASWHPAYDVDRGRIMGVYDDDPEDPSDD